MMKTEMTPQQEKFMKILNTTFEKSNDVVGIYTISKLTIRVDVKNEEKARKAVTEKVLSAIDGAKVQRKERPYDIKFNGNMFILVKPVRNQTKNSLNLDYGHLQKYDLSEFDCSEFQGINNDFASQKLTTNIKEPSDLFAVTQMNREIVRFTNGNMEGTTLRFGRYTFRDVIGCVSVTNGEPKADIVLVRKDGNKLIPDCFLSYKKGKLAKDFQSYSGISEREGSVMFRKKEIVTFLSDLKKAAIGEMKIEPFRPVKDVNLLTTALWGKKYKRGGDFGVENCHAIVQGDVKLSGNGVITYTHVQMNGDTQFQRDYQPVIGARTDNNRNIKTQDGSTIKGYRAGIFARAYRSKWMQMIR